VKNKEKRKKNRNKEPINQRALNNFVFKKVDTQENLDNNVTREIEWFDNFVIENDMLENIDLDVIINDFAFQNV
jgi:hypothetical protein